MTARLPVFLAVACLIAQDPPPIRVSTTLVQVDVVVTDREGRQVSRRRSVARSPFSWTICGCPS